MHRVALNGHDDKLPLPSGYCPCCSDTLARLRPSLASLIVLREAALPVFLASVARRVSCRVTVASWVSYHHHSSSHIAVSTMVTQPSLGQLVDAGVQMHMANGKQLGAAYKSVLGLPDVRSLEPLLVSSL